MPDMQLQNYVGGTGGFGSMVVDSLPNVLPPVAINSYSVLTIPAYWRAMNYIANNLASFPRSIQLNGVDVPHRLTPLLTVTPNRNETSYNFWRRLFFGRAHTGNAYAEIVWTPKGGYELQTWLSEVVWPFRWIDDDGNVSTYYAVSGRVPHVVAFADMIHFAGLSYDGLMGMNPITMLSGVFERARHVDNFVTRYLVKGTVMRGAIEIPAGASPERQTQIVNTVRTYFRGAEADRDVIVLSDGAHLNNSTLNNEQSQLIQLGQLSTKQVAQVTGVPPTCLFELSEGKYNNSSEQQNRAVMQDLFRPLIVADEDELSRKLLTPAEIAQGYRVHMDTSAFIRGDTATESNVAIAQKTAGIISENEARALLDYPPDLDNPDADKVSTLGGTNNPAPTPAVGAGGSDEGTGDDQTDDPDGSEGGTGPADGPAGPVQAAQVKADVPRKADPSRFAALIDHAGVRVGGKTQKAAEGARKRHGGDASALTRWGNVFAGEQAAYASAEVGPILETMRATGEPIGDVGKLAAQVGDRYAQAVRAMVAGGPEAPEPDLSGIVLKVISEGEHESES